MATFQYVCPDCRSRLKTDQAVAVGRKIKCPQCGSTFAVDVEVEEEQDASTDFADLTPRRHQTPRRREKDAQAEPDSGEHGLRRRKKSAGASNILIWAGVGIGTVG